MTDRFFLQSLEVAGFRAYLQPQKFTFGSKKRNIAIFAPNGLGKSSFVDALEFMFSDEGTLDRLGKKDSQTKPGPEPLAHNLANDNDIEPRVTIAVRSRQGIEHGTRPASGPERSIIPTVAKTLSKHFTVSPIIRGHSLRTFVEDATPEQRYREVANWLDLDPLVEVQASTRAIRRELNKKVSGKDALGRIDQKLEVLTDNTVSVWKLTDIIDHINASVLNPLDGDLELEALTESAQGYIELAERAEVDANALGLSELRLVQNSVTVLQADTSLPETGEVSSSGLVPLFASKVAALSKAESREQQERTKAANGVFQELWTAAKPLFEEGSKPLSSCPVCATPIDETAIGSFSSIRIHIEENLHNLASYSNAKKALNFAKDEAKKVHTQLVASLSLLIDLLDQHPKLKTKLVTFHLKVSDWPNVAAPDSTEIGDDLVAFTKSLTDKISSLEKTQGKHSYIGAKKIVDNILHLSSERDQALRTQLNMEELSDSLDLLAAQISTELRKHVESLLSVIKVPMNEIYRIIQSDKAVPIRLDLPETDKANQQHLFLTVDFAENRKGVKPVGYLSDSQIHSLALALRLAAIMRFNATAPIIVLDDIVTSYDADHRLAMVGCIAKMLGDCQVIITTHDERFFQLLKDQLEEGKWEFKQIIDIKQGFGPYFADHKVNEEVIEERWESGKSAANEIRQAEEEWLLRICRDFGVFVRIRSIKDAHRYGRSELASALAGFLKDHKLVPAPVGNANTPFLKSLSEGEIENFGSHHQDAQYGTGSIGDEKIRWKTFKEFRDQFKCPACGGTRFRREAKVPKPICAKPDCRSQFAF